MLRSRSFLSAIITLAASAFTATASVITVAIGAAFAFTGNFLLRVVDSFKVEKLSESPQTAGEGYGLGSRFDAYQARREARQRPHVRDTLRMCA